jgi:hypothetical protein
MPSRKNPENVSDAASFSPNTTNSAALVDLSDIVRLTSRVKAWPLPGSDVQGPVKKP